ncbi:hypothetical protein ZWY2020_007650 [Hordeum vulgare]|nr:hypothetical protein ZWY2020_007650 [Hordeum vulgare]
MGYQEGGDARGRGRKKRGGTKEEGEYTYVSEDSRRSRRRRQGRSPELAAVANLSRLFLRCSRLVCVPGLIEFMDESSGNIPANSSFNWNSSSSTITAAAVRADELQRYGKMSSSSTGRRSPPRQGRSSRMGAWAGEKEQHGLAREIEEEAHELLVHRIVEAGSGDARRGSRPGGITAAHVWELEEDACELEKDAKQLEDDAHKL